MFEADDIRNWRGESVVDDGGHKIGTLEAVYVDTVSDLPSFATVTMGMAGRRRLAFVPLRGAQVGPRYLKVSFDKRTVKAAPAIGTDDELPATEEPAVFAHYDLTYQPGSQGERRLARR
ncbi:PRC-barrel domain-containing protein [Streptomyces sp. B6B3]|uniref:PRC-barrel domain-containing protein n=1 Tax=Streptomyces sp. B6B3 TaxID=3153570 RepID=UPI00325E82EF